MDSTEFYALLRDRTALKGAMVETDGGCQITLLSVPYRYVVQVDGEEVTVDCAPRSGPDAGREVAFMPADDFTKAAAERIAGAIRAAEVEAGEAA